LVRSPLPPAVPQVRGDAQRLPFADACFDVVFCASLIEHVPRPASVLQEIARVLRPQGVAYVSFPPYYSPLGGHEDAPLHSLGGRRALASRRRMRYPEWVRSAYRPRQRPRGFADLFTGWGLYRMTLRRFRRLVAASPLLTVAASTRYLPVDPLGLPLVEEVL